MGPRKVVDRDRSFGLSVGVVLMLIAAYLIWRQRLPIAAVLGATGVTLLALGLAAPRTLRVPSALWWKLAHALGWVNSRILLSLMFFVVLTPIGLWRRILGKGRVQQLGGPNGWAAYPQRYRDAKHFERMF